MQSKMRGNAYRTTVVCVDACKDGELLGRLYNPYLENGEIFQGLMQFFLKMEDLLDSMEFPQSFTAARAFTAPSVQRTAVPPDPEPQEGKCGTFAVRVIFRQNASWQGSVTWLEGGREESFRSALELVLLMDSALNGTKSDLQKRDSSSASCGA
jgi:hypothetical protein